MLIPGKQVGYLEAELKPNNASRGKRQPAKFDEVLQAKT